MIPPEAIQKLKAQEEKSSNVIKRNASSRDTRPSTMLLSNILKKGAIRKKLKKRDQHTKARRSTHRIKNSQSIKKYESNPHR
ncbi:hypothetical protein FJZ22_02125 [Candidatus Pacearchaeota archaeon]|nr:hypothetical protein [Candidatus Pacearchaeota archaeon]